MADIKERIIIESVDKSKKGYDSAKKNTSIFNKTLNTLKTTMLGLAGFFGLNILSGWIGRLANASDTVVLMDAKVKLATDSTEEFNYAQEQLVAVSLKTNSSLEANNVLFGRLNKSIKQMGGTTQSTLSITELMNNGLKISGAQTAEANSVIRQYVQAMDSGVMRGDEFNSIMENGGRIAQALADGLGVAKGELRAMAEEGKLTAKIVNDALLSQSAVLQEEASQIPVTIGMAWQNVLTEYMVYLKDFKELNGTLAETVSLVAANFKEIATAMGVVIKVSAILYGAHLITAAKNKITSLQAERAARLATAEAVKTQALVEKEQAAFAAQVNAQVNARKTQFAAQEAAQAVKRHQQAIVDSQDTIKRLTLSEKELAAQSRQLRWEIRSNTAKKGTAFAEKQLTGLKHRHTLATESLRTATMSLTNSENKLTTAIQIQSGAIRANSAAMTASATASAVASGKLAVASSMFGMIKKGAVGLGRALLGLPGLFGYVAYEITTAFVPVDVLLAKLIHHFDRLSATASYFWDNVKNGGATDESLAQYNEQLEQINNKYYDALDAVIAGESKKRTEYKSTANQHVASSIDAIQKISAAEKTHQTAQEAALDTELAINKIALSQKITDKAAYEAAVQALENQNLVNKDQLIIDRLTKESELYSAHYDEQIVKLQEANVGVLDQIEAHFVEKMFLTDEANKDELDAMRAVESGYENRNAKILELERAKAEQLKRISKDTLAVLIADANRLVTTERDARARSKSVVKEYADFVRQINGDQRSDYQKNSDAQTLRKSIETKLREASKAELAGNHKEAQRLSEEALADAKDLATAQKDQAGSAEKGSLAQIRANGNLRVALELVKNATDNVKQSSDQLANSAKSDLDARLKDINTYKAAIKELDTQLNTDRTITASIDTGIITSQINEINNKIQALNQTVTITTKHISDGGGAEVKRADGGFIPRKDKVPGSGSGDKVKALLEPGEFIMQKSAVQRFGESAMVALNSGKDIIKRKAGGIIPGIQRFAAGGSVGDDNDNGFVKNLTNRYTSMLSEWIGKAQQPGRGLSDLRRNKAASQVVKTIQGVLDVVPKLKDKDPAKTNRIISFSEKIINKAKELYSHHETANYNQNFSERSRLKAVRDSLVQTLSTGGSVVKRFSQGGKVKGKGIGDKVRALLTPDEYVIKKDIVKKLGDGFFDGINAGIMPQKFASGGLVGDGGSTGSGSGFNDNTETINVNLNFNGSQTTGSFQKNDATMDFINQLKAAEAST